jgi:hypothetical protein
MSQINRTEAIPWAAEIIVNASLYEPVLSLITPVVKKDNIDIYVNYQGIFQDLFKLKLLLENNIMHIL